MLFVLPSTLLALRPDAALLPLRRTDPIKTRFSMATMGPNGAPKVVVTGIGVVSALGSGDQFWEALLAGECGIDTITAFDASELPTTIGAECKVCQCLCWNPGAVSPELSR